MKEQNNQKNDRIPFEENGLKCDAPGCKWVDNTVKFDDFEKWIDQPCPICGANVLTAGDCADALTFKAYIAQLNEMSDEEFNEFQEKSTAAFPQNLELLEKQGAFLEDSEDIEIMKESVEKRDPIEMQINFNDGIKITSAKRIKKDK